MARAFHDFSISPAERQRWRRAADELLINAIFGTTPELDQIVDLEFADRRRRGRGGQRPDLAVDLGADPDALFTPL